MRCNPGHSHRHIHHHHHHHSHCGPCYGGSVFTFSHHCGGHSGGFWGGFGAGLGMGLGNMLGGFMNSFTCGFGNMFGGFGMGGFGMPMMGGFGMPWAASYGGGTVKDDAYFASRYGTGKSSSTSTSSVESGEEVKANEEAETKTETKAATGKIGDIEIDNLTQEDVSNIKKDDYDALGDTDKVNLKGKFKGLVQDDPDKAAEWANSDTLPDDLVKIARASFYTEGNTNYDGKEEIDASKIVRAHDTYSEKEESGGLPRDVEPNDAEGSVVIIQAAEGNHPQTIKIYDDGVEEKDEEKAITYEYKETKHGEYIYKSDRNQQEYVLQKTSSGKYELVQYCYHTGWSKKDANSAES